jgi:hypothetical protein
LQALLAGAFEQKSVVRLSERNVVELVRQRHSLFAAAGATALTRFSAPR